MTRSRASRYFAMTELLLYDVAPCRQGSHGDDTDPENYHRWIPENQKPELTATCCHVTEAVANCDRFRTRTVAGRLTSGVSLAESSNGRSALQVDDKIQWGWPLLYLTMSRTGEALGNLPSSSGCSLLAFGSYSDTSHTTFSQNDSVSNRRSNAKPYVIVIEGAIRPLIIV